MEQTAKGREAPGSVNQCWGVSDTVCERARKEGAAIRKTSAVEIFHGYIKTDLEGQSTPYVTLLDFNVPTYNFLSLLLSRVQPNLNYYY